MSTNRQGRPSGFVALLSAVIISAALLVLAISGNLAGFYHRFNVLDREEKAESFALAEACASVALLQLGENPDWAGNATSTVGSDECYIGPVSHSGTEALFETRGVYHHAYTTLQITFDTQTLSVVAWKEVPIF